MNRPNYSAPGFPDCVWPVVKGLAGKVCFRHCSLLMILLLLSQSLSAQKYKHGYVLLNNGDTLKGLVETENWVKAPLVVRFKQSPAAEVHTYSPLLIRSFRVDSGDWYFSFVGDIDPSSLLDNQLTYDSLPDTMRVVFFIRSVVMGKMSLYYARDVNDRVHLFIQKDGGAIEELKYKKYYVDEKVVADYRNEITRRAIMSNQIYKEQLTHLMADCPPVAAGIVSQPISYSKNDIMKLVLSYNRCKASKTSYLEKKDSWKFDVRAHFGINYSALAFTSTSDTYISNSVFDPSLGYVFGISLNAVLPRTQEHWGICNELFIRSFASNGNSGVAPFKEQRLVQMDLIYGKLATLIRYQVQKTKVKPFLSAGITNGLALKTTNLESDSAGITYPFIQSFRNYEQGLLFGLGVEWRSVLWETQLEFSNAMSGYSEIKSSFTTFYVTMGYKF